MYARRLVPISSFAIASLLAAAASGQDAAALDPFTGAPLVDPGASGMVIDPDTGAWASPDALLVDPDEPRVVFGGQRELGGWGGLSTGITSINGQPAQLVGFGGGLLLDHSFTIGLGGWGIASWVDADPEIFKARGAEPAPHYIEGGWGGLLLAYEPWARSVVHPIVSANLGVGAVTYSQRQYEEGWDEEWDVDGEIRTPDDRPVGVFGSTDLSVGATVNVARWCRLDATLGYRWVGGLQDFEGLDDGELGGASAGIGLRFGRF